MMTMRRTLKMVRIITHPRSTQEATKRRIFLKLMTSNVLVHTLIEKTLMVQDLQVIIKKLELVNSRQHSSRTAKHNIKKVVYLK